MPLNAVLVETTILVDFLRRSIAAAAVATLNEKHFKALPGVKVI